MMDEKYILGIPEIDAQHEEISALVDSLKATIERKGQRHLVHQTVKRLHQTLVTHFAFEDAAMESVGYADFEQHKKMHQGVLRLFETYYDHLPETSDYEHLGRTITDKVLGHVMEHDTKMTESVRAYLSKTTSKKRKP